MGQQGKVNSGSGKAVMAGDRFHTIVSKRLKAEWLSCPHAWYCCHLVWLQRMFQDCFPTAVLISLLRFIMASTHTGSFGASSCLYDAKGIFSSRSHEQRFRLIVLAN